MIDECLLRAAADVGRGIMADLSIADICA